MTKIAVLLLGLFILLGSPAISAPEKDESYSPDQLQEDSTPDSGPSILLFPTITECGPDESMYELARRYGETPFAVSRGVVMSKTLGTLVEGTTIITVNPSTGTWTMFWSQDNGITCITASGSNFTFIFGASDKSISL